MLRGRRGAVVAKKPPRARLNRMEFQKPLLVSLGSLRIRLLGATPALPRDPGVVLAPPRHSLLQRARPAPLNEIKSATESRL